MLIYTVYTIYYQPTTHTRTTTETSTIGQRRPLRHRLAWRPTIGQTVALVGRQIRYRTSHTLVEAGRRRLNAIAPVHRSFLGEFALHPSDAATGARQLAAPIDVALRLALGLLGAGGRCADRLAAASWHMLNGALDVLVFRQYQGRSCRIAEVRFVRSLVVLQRPEDVVGARRDDERSPQADVWDRTIGHCFDGYVGGFLEGGCGFGLDGHWRTYGRISCCNVLDRRSQEGSCQLGGSVGIHYLEYDRLIKIYTILKMFTSKLNF